MDDITALIKKVVNNKTDPGLSDHEKTLIRIMDGGDPKNKYERDLKKEINKLRAEGKIIEIPSM